MPRKKRATAAPEGAIDPERLPRTVAIIMDGNGRWARRRGLPRVAGHAAARESVRSVVMAASELGIENLVLYTFSMENWNRPRAEVSALMHLLDQTLRDQADEMDRNGVSLHFVGRIDLLPKYVIRRLESVGGRLAGNTGLRLYLALSYGGRAEIVDAARAMADRAKRGELSPGEIDEEAFAGFLYAPELPDPDLLIRTSGELRISNFLLWQVAYSEIYFTGTLWPDFRAEHLRDAVRDYQGRERRFGGVSPRRGGRRKQ